MIEEKQDIILSEGVPVLVTDLSGTVISTKALVGRASKQFDNTVSLEINRRAQFLPNIGVVNGCTIANVVTGEKYLIIATMPEVIAGGVASVICHLYLCNEIINVSGLTKTADDDGNITTVPVAKYTDTAVYIQPLTADLKAYDPGLHPDANFRIFAPLSSVDLLDTVTVSSNSNAPTMKVVSVDFISFEGIVIIQTRTETRG